MISSVNIQPAFSSSLEEKKAVAAQIFQAPGAHWEVFQQPFWKHSVIFHLTSSEWPHRPFVAVDEEDKGFLLTCNVVHVSASSIIKNFNHLTLQEIIEITANNIEEYARFFAAVYSFPSWNREDRIGYIRTQLTQEKDQQRRKEAQKVIDQILVSQKEGLHLKINPIAENFSVQYFWRDGDYSVQSSVLIHHDGTINLQEKENWQPLTERNKSNGHSPEHGGS